MKGHRWGPSVEGLAEPTQEVCFVHDLHFVLTKSQAPVSTECLDSMWVTGDTTIYSAFPCSLARKSLMLGRIPVNIRHPQFQTGLRALCGRILTIDKPPLLTNNKVISSPPVICMPMTRLRAPVATSLVFVDMPSYVSLGTFHLLEHIISVLMRTRRLP